MTNSLSFIVFSYLAGGLVLFLLGMKYMSEGMQAVAGDRLRRLIHAVTDNRLIACGVGFAVTCIIQSSSVTTVMAVGMVNAGLMTLAQAIGVTLGADIGTTITAWIVALDVFIKGGVLVLGLPIMGLAGFFYLFSKNERVRFAAMMAMGVGMVFFGLDLMKDGVKPFRTMPEFQAWFSKFTPDSLFGVIRCVVVGAVLTGIVQSSSATVGITMVLASDKVINVETAFALVIGENIGTTITAFLASLGTGRNAKRTAYAHILIKVVGALWAIPILWLGMDGLKSSLGQQPAMVAISMFHTGFNVLNVLIFLPLVRTLARFLMRVYPDKVTAEAPHLAYLDVRLLEAPAIGIQQSGDEVVRMGEKVESMLLTLGEILPDGAVDEPKAKTIFDAEDELDDAQREVTIFLSRLLSGSVPLDIMDRGRQQLRMADEYESISDYLVRILKMHRKLQKSGGYLTQESLDKVLDIHQRVTRYVQKVNQAVKTGKGEILSNAKNEAQEITNTRKAYRDSHLAQFATNQSSPLASLVFTDSLNAYGRVRGHALNIAQAVAGGK